MRLKREDLIYQKLANAKEYLSQLKELHPHSVDGYISNLKNKRAIERQIQLVVEAVIDAGEIIVIDLSARPPRTRKEVITKLRELKVITPGLATKIIPLVSLRNRIVHEYDVVKDDLVYLSIKKVVDGVNDLTNNLTAYLSASNQTS